MMATATETWGHQFRRGWFNAKDMVHILPTLMAVNSSTVCLTVGTEGVSSEAPFMSGRTAAVYRTAPTVQHAYSEQAASAIPFPRLSFSTINTEEAS
mmetsp:Transcript_8625/g.31829  ORF Transcript_8625/g.31829 Transcript_8625/m.31829 type:complete len:97 (-) Transcript_8625:31-321(-)